MAFLDIAFVTTNKCFVCFLLIFINFY